MAIVLPTQEPRYVHRFTVQFDESDPGGIAFFANAYKYAHRAYEAYLRSIGLTDFFSASDFICPFVHTECDHKSPMRPGEQLDVHVYVSKLGNTSMTTEFRIHGGNDRALVRLISVFVDPTTFQPVAIPERIRAALQR